MKAILLTSVLTLSLFIGYAQIKLRDSLKHELTISRPDTNRVLVLAELINDYKFDIPDSAFFYGQQALTLARQIKFPKGEAQALLFLSVTNRALGNTSKALELRFKGLQIAEKNNLIGEKQHAMTLLGSSYMDLGNYSQALFYLYKALKLNDPNDSKSPNRFCLTLITLASTYLSMNKLDSAKYYSQSASDSAKQYNLNWVQPVTLMTMGRIHNKKGEPRLAFNFFRQVLNYNSSGFSAYFEIAKLHQHTNQPDSAIYYARKSLSNAQKSNAYSNIIDAAKLLAELYQFKDAQKAIEYNKLTIAAQDTLNNFGKTNAFKSITEFDEKERLYEIETAKTAYKNQTRQYVLLAGLGIFSLIAFILFRNNRQKQRTNELLEKQKQEIDLQRANAEQTLSELKTTQSQLIQSEKMASLGELTAGIAHEIQNPLNFVNNFSEVSSELLDEMITELVNDNKKDAIAIAVDVKQNLDKILHHGKQADGIVKGMLQHSRSSSAIKEPTDINKLADEYLRLAFHGLRAKDKSFNATLKTDYDEAIGNINIVPQDMGRVILNLITNSFYAVTEKNALAIPITIGTSGQKYEPTVSVITKKIGDKIQIKVSDNGNGIPQKALDKIFQPFFTTKPPGQGTGLGLSLSYDIVKAHGGEMKVETREARPDDQVGRGEGSEFTILLPLSKKE